MDLDSDSDGGEFFEDDHLADEDEEELERTKLQLEDPGTVRNPNGTYRCPFCAGRMKQDYRYNEIRTHAEATSKGGSSLKQLQHKLLLDRLEHKEMQPEATLRQSTAQPLSISLDNEEEKRLFPPVVILMNVPRWKEWSEEQRKPLHGGTTKGQLLATFKDFQPQKAEPIYGYGGHQGCAVVVFPPTVMGWKNAERLSNALAAKEHGQAQWQGGRASGSSSAEQEVGLGGKPLFEPYGWVASEQDLSTLRDGPLLKLLMKHTPKTFSQVHEEDTAAAQRVGRDRERQSEREMQRLTRKLQESETRRLAAERDAEEMRERFRQELEMVQRRTKQAVAEESARRLAETREVERRYNELKAKVETSRDVEAELQAAQQQLAKLDLDSRKAENRAHRFQERRQQFDEQVQQMKINMLEEERQAVEEGAGEEGEDEEEELRQRIEELKEQLQTKEEEFDLQSDQLNAVTVTSFDQKNDVSAAKKHASKFLAEFFSSKRLVGLVREHQRASPVRIKLVGQFNKLTWKQGYMERHAPHEDRVLEFTKEFSAIEDDFVRRQDIRFVRVKSAGAKQEWVFNVEEPEVAGLFAKVEREFGPAALDDLKETLLLIETCNGSGRYTEKHVWNHLEKREATVTETVKLLTGLLTLLELQIHPSNSTGIKKRRGCVGMET